MMKKYLVLVMVMMMVPVVLAADVSHPSEIGVIADLTLTPTPTSLDFGDTVTPGSQPTVELTLTPGTSNLDVSVAITGDALIVGMLSNRTGSYVDFNADSFSIGASTPLVFNTKLVVPAPYASGTYSGTITYTVMEGTT